MKRALLSLAFALAACGGPPTPAEPTFSIRLEPPVMSLRVTETGNAKVVLNRVAGFAEAVTVTLEGDSAGLTATSLTIAGTQTEGTLSFAVGDAAKPGTSFPTVKATAKAISKTTTLTLRVAGAVAEVSQTTVEANAGGTQVRQGAGEVTLEITGKNLERVSALRLGDLETSMLPGRTATRIGLRAKVPHGASVGAKDLVLTADGGDTVRAGALTVTPITASPAGNDTSGSGTTEKPFRSLKKALSLAQAGDTVRLQNGTYNAAGGETWPDVSSGTPNPNVPVGVTVEGESQAGTVLEGSGLNGTLAGLVFAGDGAVTRLTAQRFQIGFNASAGAVRLEGVLGQANSAGFRAVGGTAKVSNAEFKQNTWGLLAFGAAKLELVGGSAHDNTSYGVYLLETATLKATDFVATANANGVSATDQADVTLERVKLHGNRLNGLQATTPSQVTLALTGCELYNNAQNGLSFGGKQLVVRGSAVHHNRFTGVSVGGAPSKVDFGNQTEPGNNDLHDNGLDGIGTQIGDARLNRATLGDPNTFTLRATKLNGANLPADIYPTNGVWPYQNPPYFAIGGNNNVIRVY